MSKQIEALKLALDYIVATNKSSQFWLVPESNLNRTVTAIREALAEQPTQQQEPANLFETFKEFGEGWESLAWELCADENGEEACTELIWEGGPIPEPWGDRWLKYEDEAKRLIALVHKHTSPPASKPWVGLTEEDIMKILDYDQYGRVPQYARNFVDAIEAKLKEKNNG